MVFFLVFALVAHSRCSEMGKETGGEDVKAVDAGRFQFKAPVAWTRAPKSEEDELKRTMLAGAKKIVDTSKVPLKFDDFCVFQTPGQAMVLVYAVPIPENMSAHDYLVKLRAMNETKFEYGRQSGIVKKVIKIKLTEAEGLSTLATEYLAVQGKNNRTCVYALAAGPSPEFAVTITAFFPENDDGFHERVKKVMESVEFRKGP